MCIPVAHLKVGQLPGFVIYTTTVGLCLLKIFEVFVFSTRPPCSSIAGGRYPRLDLRPWAGISLWGLGKCPGAGISLWGYGDLLLHQ